MVQSISKISTSSERNVRRSVNERSRTNGIAASGVHRCCVHYSDAETGALGHVQSCFIVQDYNFYLVAMLHQCPFFFFFLLLTHNCNGNEIISSYNLDELRL